MSLVQGLFLFLFFFFPSAHLSRSLGLSSLRQVAILEMLFLNVLKAFVVRWMLSSVWVFSVWLSIHLSLTEMELSK